MTVKHRRDRSFFLIKLRSLLISALYKNKRYEQKTIANPSPIMVLLEANNLQIVKNRIIPKAEKINSFSSTIHFILQSTITQITTEIAYPIKVASEAPSISAKGEAEEESQSEELEKEKLGNQVEVQNDFIVNGSYGSGRESLIEPEHRTGDGSISKVATASIETMAVADVGLCYAIFQLKDEPELRDYRNMSIRNLLRQGMVNDHFDEITPEHYDQIYNGVLYRIPGLNENEMMENIFMRFNTEVMPDFNGHSLSVGDVIVLNQHGKLNAYYVDSCGFKELPEFARKLEKAGIQFDLPEFETRKAKNPMIESVASVRWCLKEKKRIVAAGVISTGRNPLTKDVKGKKGINPVLSSV